MIPGWQISGRHGVREARQICNNTCSHALVSNFNGEELALPRIQKGVSTNRSLGERTACCMLVIVWVVIRRRRPEKKPSMKHDWP